MVQFGTLSLFVARSARAVIFFFPQCQACEILKWRQIKLYSCQMVSVLHSFRFISVSCCLSIDVSTVWNITS